MILKDSIKEKWSKSEAFLLPLTGLRRDIRFDPHTYLFWGKFSIENYQLILTYNNEEGIDTHCKNVVFPAIDNRCIILENYNLSERVIFVIDVSVWGKDIDMFLKGKYSMFSKDAQKMIEQFHLLEVRSVPEHIFGVLYPAKPSPAYGNKSAIEAIAHEYGLDMNTLMEIGEIGSIYDRTDETLLTDVEDLMT